MRRCDPSTARSRRRVALAALALTPLLALAGCGSGGSSGPSGTSASPASDAAVTGSVVTGSAVTGSAVTGSGVTGSGGAVTYPVTVQGDDGAVTIPAQPRAIVSLGASLTEMLFAIGAGSQVKAVDDQSNYPADAPRTKLSGFTPNVEAIAGYQPDLVVLTNDDGKIVKALKDLKVPVLLLGAPKTIDASYTEELALGQATGHPAQAQQAVDTTRRRIAAAVASVPRSTGPRTVYHELDPTYYSVTSATFIGDLYRQFGLTDIADKAPKAAGGYPQLSAEFVVSAAPSLIVLADGRCCGQSPATVAKRPAFASVPAVTSGKVVVINDDIASRWGPRLADFAELIAKALSPSAG